MENDRADKEVVEMSKIKVNEQRAVDEFQELTVIDAPSFGERQMADRLIVKLKELGFEVEEDNAGKHFGGNAGNLYAYLPGDLPGDPVLLSGHMDTVEPSKGKKGIIGEDGVIRSAGKAVLGADDVAGLVEILEGIRSVKEAGVPHRDIEILFAIVHSATKFIGGHGTTLGGIIVDSGKFDWKASGKYPAIADANPSYHGVSFVDAAGPAAFVTYIRAILLRDMGATISPFNAFLLLQGTETLSLRIDRHVENTKKVVEYLSNHPMVEHVNHPSLPNHPDHALYEKYFPNGGASIFTFEIKGGQEEAHKFIDNLKIFSLLANVADVKSLVIHPATTTHSQLTEEELLDQGIKPNTIRLSIGTEHIDDIIADLEGGFAAVQGK